MTKNNKEIQSAWICFFCFIGVIFIIILWSLFNSWISWPEPIGYTADSRPIFEKLYEELKITPRNKTQKLFNLFDDNFYKLNYDDLKKW